MATPHQPARSGATPPASLGERLRRARQERSLSFAEAAALTKLKPTYLQALEDNRYDDLPAPFYAKNFIHMYGNALGLDGKQLAQEFGAQHTNEVALPPAHHTGVSYHISVGVGRLLQRPLFLVIGATVLVVVVIYLAGGAGRGGGTVTAGTPDDTARCMAEYRPVFDTHEPLPALP
jgi:cytoskeletal protein RodZ